MFTQVASSDGFGGLFLIMMLVALLITVVALVVWAGVGFWAYRDAESRGIDNPPLWGAIVFLTGVIGLLIYVLKRDDLAKK